MACIILLPRELDEGKRYMEKRNISSYQIIDPRIPGWCEKIETGNKVFMYPNEQVWRGLLEDEIYEEDIYIIPTISNLVNLIRNNSSKILKEAFKEGNNYLLKIYYDCDLEYSLQLFSIFMYYAFEYKNLMIISHYMKRGIKSTNYHYLPIKDFDILMKKYPESNLKISTVPFQDDLSSPLKILHSSIQKQDINLLKLLSPEEIKDLSGNDDDMNISPLIVPFGVLFTKEYLKELLERFPYELTYETTRLYRIAIASAELTEYYPLFLKGSMDPQDLLDLNPKYDNAFSYILMYKPELYIDRILQNDLAWAFRHLPKGNYSIPEKSILIKLLI